MFSYANKALVQAILAVATLLDLYFGFSVGWLTEEWLLAVIAVLGPFLVYWTPNRPR